MTDSHFTGHMHFGIIEFASDHVQKSQKHIAKYLAGRRTMAALCGLSRSQLADIGAESIVEDQPPQTPVSARTMTYLMSLR